jgi:hypothetical protein
MRKRFSLALVAGLLLVVGLIALVPTVRAGVTGMVSTWLNFTIPLLGDADVSLPDDALTFRPLHPTYMPDGFSAGTVVTRRVDDESVFLLGFVNGEQFIAITERAAQAGEGLPEGEAMTVNGQDASLVTGLAGTLELKPEEPSPEEAVSEGVEVVVVEAEAVVSIDESEEAGPEASEAALPDSMDYSDASQLTWVVDGVKLELLSTLSPDEMLRVAESMVQAEEGYSTTPFGSPVGDGTHEEVIIERHVEEEIEASGGE